MNRILVSLLLAATLFVSRASAEDAHRARGWPDSAPLTKQNLVLGLEDGGFVRVDVLGQRLFRIRYSKDGKWTRSGLNRYGILADQFPEVPFQQTEAKGVITITT